MVRFFLSMIVGISTVGSVYTLPTDPGHQIYLEAESSIAASIRDILIDNKVIGDVLDDFNPDYYLDISYPKFHESVRLGNDIPVKSVSDRPAFIFQPLTPLKPPTPRIKDTEDVFTLILTDPDAKSRDKPKWSEMCHWIITNLTDHTREPPPFLEPSGFPSLKYGEVEKYLPPGPPPKTGPHRYVFVLLRGHSTHVEAPKDRKHWGYGKVRHGVRDWAAENNLTVVGANFFFAQNVKQ
ncbi:hypothetical protein LTR84_006073 [Exophiala bonariae]|uniref:YbhB/YbcL family Raf kinase inhibitor-like protein n=1 Tax=Exophiala bonariae TaxID=1690606 RepID=A0AAV9N1G4_9EURO|nr:hypothetical protein LTR84_006073 [Exophiala bonariae]